MARSLRGPMFHLPIAGFWAETQKVEDTVRGVGKRSAFPELAEPSASQSDSQAHVSGVIERCSTDSAQFRLLHAMCLLSVSQ